ncbi:MAG: type II toxin-antitoxin system VapB family antitoxin [Pseudomonadota bacterium]
MPIYVKDATATQLLDEVMALSDAPSKTAAIIEALRERKHTLQQKKPLRERIAPLQAEIAAKGSRDPNFDMKAFFDDLCGE